MNLMSFVVIWTAMALTVLGLAFYRKFVARREDDLIHLSDGEAKLIPRQFAVAHTLKVVDRWGKTLTILMVVGGLLLEAIFIYQHWSQTLRPTD